MEFFIGKIFMEMYPSEAADWCNNNDCFIEELEPVNGVRKFIISEVVQNEGN